VRFLRRRYVMIGATALVGSIGVWGYGLLIAPLPDLTYGSALEPAQGCDPELWDRTYNRPWLRTFKNGECVHVSGTIHAINPSSFDGDLCLDIVPDERYRPLLSPGNASGLLIVEAICQGGAWFWPADRMCQNLTHRVVVPSLAVGDRIQVVGRLVGDCWHECHTEIHPVSQIILDTPPH